MMVKPICQSFEKAPKSIRYREQKHEGRNANMGKRRILSRRNNNPLIAGLLLLAVALGVGLAIHQSKDSKFANGTEINEVDCSNLTVEQATEKLENAEVIIKFSEEVSYTISGKELGRTIEDTKAVQSLLSKQKDEKQSTTFQMPTNLYDESTGTSEDVYYVDGKIMEEYLKALPELNPANMKESQNAYLAQTEEGILKIIPEVYGNKIEINEAIKFAYQQLKCGNNVINFTVIGSVPEIMQDDPELVTTRERINRILLTTVNYELAEGNTYTLNLETMKDWVQQDEEGKYNLDLETHVDEIVDELAEKIQKIGLYRTVTTKTGTYTLPVAYGYRDKLDKEAEKKQLIEELEHGGLYNRMPCYSRFNDYENLETYIESSISEQRTWMYVDDEKILDAPHISGMKGVNDSPTGIFYSNFKARNYPLSKFSITIVDPWITIYNDVGYHGASGWRSNTEYTKDRYTWDGSHGCFNMIDNESLIIYHNIVLEVTPIIIHD